MRTILILMLLGSSLSSHALEPYKCRNGHFPLYDAIRLAEIVSNSSGKVFARRDWDGCPEKDECIQKGYVIKGDKVLLANPEDGWVCIYYYGKNSDYVGWVRQEEVREIDFTIQTDLNAWLGKWESIGSVNSIEISHGKSGLLQVDGKAKWFGGKNSFGDEMVNFGEVKGAAHLNGNSIEISEGAEDYSCVLNLKLIESFLVATDNEKCGGSNVRFNGIYRQKP